MKKNISFLLLFTSSFIYSMQELALPEGVTRNLSGFDTLSFKEHTKQKREYLTFEGIKQDGDTQSYRKFSTLVQPNRLEPVPSETPIVFRQTHNGAGKYLTAATYLVDMGNESYEQEGLSEIPTLPEEEQHHPSYTREPAPIKAHLKEYVLGGYKQTLNTKKRTLVGIK